MSEWQPIETAPRDGSQILLFRPDFSDQIMVGWHTKLDEWVTGYFDQKPFRDPTHWMPLPDPPQGA